jgi:hypothetical protein
MSTAPADFPVREVGAEPAVIAVYWYSQTGQLRECLEHFLEPLVAAGCEVRWIEVTTSADFPFPWSLGRFFGVFAEAADAESTVDISVGDGSRQVGDDVDLVLVAHQVWYLNPSIPMRSLVRRYPERVTGLPVVQFIACRTMWVSAAVNMRSMLTAAGARPVGVIAVTDTASQLVSLFTTLRWLLLGRREASFGLRAAGVPDAEHQRLRRLGRQLVEAGADTREQITAVLPEVLAQAESARENAAVVGPDLLAGMAFRFASRLIRRYTEPGGLGEKSALAGFVGALGTGIALGLPVATVLRIVFRRRVDAAITSYLDRALYAVADDAVPARRGHEVSP